MRFVPTTIFLVFAATLAVAEKDNRVHYVPAPLANPPPPYAINGTICQKTVPGLARMAQGIDISSLDLFPSDITGINGFRQSLFDYTCNEKRSWADPTFPEDIYEIPDQVQNVIKVPAGSLNIKTRYNEKMEQYKDSMAVKVDLQMSYGLFGAFSASAGYKETQEKLLKSDKSISETSATVSAFEVNYKSKSQMYLSQYFTEAVSELPPKYSTDPAIYDNFVHTFGTHYFEVAKFGGYLFQKTIIENSYLETANQKDINLNLAASFKLFVKVDASGEIGQISEEARKEFSQNSEVSFYHYGGNSKQTNNPEDGSLDEWWKTVGKDPWLFGGQVRPIENLISDLEKRKSVQIAVFVKLAKLYLGDARSAFDQAGISMTPEVVEALKRYESELANPTIASGSIEDINRKIKEIFADLQKAIDASKGNQLDSGAKFDRFIKTIQNDRTCECLAHNREKIPISECHKENSGPGMPSLSQCKDRFIEHNSDADIWCFGSGTVSGGGPPPGWPNRLNGTSGQMASSTPSSEEL